jgi:hypothetical protein
MLLGRSFEVNHGVSYIYLASEGDGTHNQCSVFSIVAQVHHEEARSRPQLR